MPVDANGPRGQLARSSGATRPGPRDRVGIVVRWGDAAMEPEKGLEPLTCSLRAVPDLAPCSPAQSQARLGFRLSVVTRIGRPTHRVVSPIVYGVTIGLAFVSPFICIAVHAMLAVYVVRSVCRRAGERRGRVTARTLTTRQDRGSRRSAGRGRPRTPCPTLRRPHARAPPEALRPRSVEGSKAFLDARARSSLWPGAASWLRPGRGRDAT